MKLASLCDGIGSAHLAARSVGWTSVASSEIDPVCNAVVAHHFPDVEHLGDMNAPSTLDRMRELAPRVIMSSTPCQAFSTNGLRRSLDDDRGNLTLAMVTFFRDVKPDWLVWENVLGVLSTKDNAFGHLLGGLLGSGGPVDEPRGGWPNVGAARGDDCQLAWRVVDSQGFVPQRRRRLFLVATRGNRDPVEVLFEPADAAPGSERVAAWAAAAVADPDLPLVFDWQAAGAGNDRSFKGLSRRWLIRAPGLVGTLNTCRVDAMLVDGLVRKITTGEAQALMGLPEGYLDAVRWKGKPIPIGKMHALCGNSIVVPILEWIFGRIQRHERSMSSVAVSGSRDFDERAFPWL
ncbi:DNA cytosine methyltransferase [Rhizobium laguerreae]|uniref:DNA cytosine methyltransferase n=1 Tax=Rhizobium laguerreae TaxID=1076926 RepID=UPI001C90E37A|nr:DNA cytosine methyltransferase [Rhizobium laguerreae]MBY3151280.1 DNA cytosine methyltransferase [Rhizobium laguerreae]